MTKFRGGKGFRHKKSANYLTMIGSEAREVMNLLTRNINQHNPHNSFIGNLHICYVAPATSFMDQVSVGLYYEENEKLIADPEMVFLRTATQHIHNPNAWMHGTHEPPKGGDVYYPVSFAAESTEAWNYCMTFTDSGFPESVDKRMQRKMAIFAGDWLHEIKLSLAGEKAL